MKAVDCVSFHVYGLDAGIKFYESLGLNLIWRTENSCGLSTTHGITEVVLTSRRENTVVQFLVDDVEDFLPKFIAAGGRVLVDTFDIDVGKCAVVEDKWYNEFCVLDTSKGLYQVDSDKNVVGVSHD